MKDISKIITRKLLNTASKADQEALNEWNRKSEKNSAFTNQLEEYWNHPKDEIQNNKLEQVRGRLLARINSTESKQAIKSIQFYITRIAAAVILIVSIASLSIYFANQSMIFDSNKWVQVSTESGQRSQLTLPDGSHVWLNADTDIKYSVNKKLRKVKLCGEAYFEVEHAANHPFIVETGNGQIKVLGTKFNVSHYKDSEITEASLLSGKITMTLPKSNKELEINPGERIVYNSKDHSFIKETDEVQKDILWRTGVLVFENETFDSLIQKLERYYAVKISYPKEKFNGIHYTGTIDNLRIDRVIEFLSLTIPMNYEINDQTIMLRK